MLSEELNLLLCQTYWRRWRTADVIGIRSRVCGGLAREGSTHPRRGPALYRDKSGNYGLVDQHCPHRRADMTWFRRGRGLRHHGWLFDHTGQSAFTSRSNAAPGGPLRTRFASGVPGAGKPLLWAYLGPQPRRCCPTGTVSSRGYKQIAISNPGNWFQCQEN